MAIASCRFILRPQNTIPASMVEPWTTFCFILLITDEIQSLDNNLSSEDMEAELKEIGSRLVDFGRAAASARHVGPAARSRD